MAYSSESCMVSEKKAKLIRMKQILTKERRETLKKIFDRYQEEYREERRQALKEEKG